MKETKPMSASLPPIAPGALPSLGAQPPAPRRADEAAPAAPQLDQAMISTAGAELSRPDGADAPDLQKVEAVRRQIAEGSYSPDPRAIAERLIQEAWDTRG